MHKNALLRTNILVCIILIIGFAVTSVISYRSNFGIFQKNIEQVSALASDGLYYQIESTVSAPVTVSLAMADDSFLKRFLSEEEARLNDSGYAEELSGYLSAYQKKHGYSSAFIVSSKTGRYYRYNGLDRVLSSGNPEDAWYFDFLESRNDYFLNVDNDQSANGVITLFINCKIRDGSGGVLGVIGIGLQIDSLQALFKDYDEKYGVRASFVDNAGVVQLSSGETGFAGKNLFDAAPFAASKAELLENREGQKTLWYSSGQFDGYVAARYVAALNWHLVVENDTSLVSQRLREQFLWAVGVILFIILLVLVTITAVIRRYHTQLTRFTDAPELEYQQLLQAATEGLYENIFELDITHNRAVGERTRAYFESLGIRGDSPYDEALKVIAQKQIKEEFIEGYLKTYAPSNVLTTFDSGVNTLSYDFMITNGDGAYHWMRISGRIFFWASDRAVHMISYRKNIDAEKNREAVLLEKSQRDSLTGLYNKRTTEDLISAALFEDTGKDAKHAFLVFDIDNFKFINDSEGHAAGDAVISEFSQELKAQFRESDVAGRIGGDEFTILMKNYGSLEAVREKLERLCARVSYKDFGTGMPFHITLSAGVSLFPDQGTTYSELYEKADQALYFSKGHGKATFHIYGMDVSSGAAFHVNQRDMESLINSATDGISKIAWIDGAFHVLYFNEQRLALTGTPAKILSSPSYNVLAQIHPDDIGPTLEVFERVMPTRTPFEVFYRLRHFDGHYVPVRLRGIFVNELYEGRYPIFYASYTDLSEIASQDSATGVSEEAPT